MYRPYAAGASLSTHVVLIQVVTTQVVRGQFSSIIGTIFFPSVGQFRPNGGWISVCRLESFLSVWRQLHVDAVRLGKPLLRRSIRPASSSSERAVFTVMVLLSSAAAIFSMGNIRYSAASSSQPFACESVARSSSSAYSSFAVWVRSACAGNGGMADTAAAGYPLSYTL